MRPNNDTTHISLPLARLHQWHANLQQAFAHSDSADALIHLAGALEGLVGMESMLISRECKGRAPQLLHQQGIPEQHHEAVLQRYFAAGYLLDPFCLAVQKGLAQGFYPLEEIAPDHFFDSDYYRTYYLGTGCSEDSYYIVDLDDGSKISLSLFQGRSGQRLDSEQLDLLRAVEPMVRELLARYARHGLAEGVEQGARHSVEQAFASFGRDVLTVREREVAHRVLQGHSVKSTARELGISPETVRMHRKNLYLKLGINSQSELFAQFIGWLQGSTA
ncbi:LuxR C-terminal-related transcriptional regulator [Pseudomonas sp. X10]